MPSLDQHPAFTTVKALCVGDSGTGKTGALASLVDEGFHLRILDFDDGLRPLAGYVKDKTKLRNIHYATFRDQFKLVGGRMSISVAPAFQRCMDTLEKGFEGTEVKGVDTWTETFPNGVPRNVLVLDTLGMAGRACLNMVLMANAAGGKAPEIQHYGTAMENIEKLIAKLTSPSVACHLIINTHLTGQEGTTKLYPESLGTKLNPKIGRYFDNMVSTSISAGKKRFNTKVDGLLALKTARNIADTYPIETGWRDIFLALLDRKSLVE